MLQFFERVLPTQPNYVLTLGRGAMFWNRNHATLAELATAAAKHDAAGLAVYFGVAAYEGNVGLDDKGKDKVFRKAAQASLFRTLACDIDVGETKPYQTQKDAARALLTACSAVNLPTPMLVSSGYGLHCYWPLDQDISKTQWVVLSTALRALLEGHGVALDRSKVCDPSMVLRPVGTYNRKDPATPQLVRILRDCQPYTVADLRAVLKSPDLAAPPARAPGSKRQSALLSAVLEGNDFPPGDAVQIALKCPQLMHVSSMRGDVTEPLWYAALGVAAYCEDADNVAQQWSDGHKQYTEDATLAKMVQWKNHSTGPATCAAFEKAEPARCKACQHYGKITSPIQLSISAPDPIAPEITLPPRYQISNGKLMHVGSGAMVAICEFPLFVKERRFDHSTSKTVVVLDCQMPVEPKEVLLPVDTLTAGNDKWLAFLYNNNIVPGKSPGHVTGIRHYIMTYLEELQRKVAPTPTYGRFGWHDDSFIMGAKRYHAAGVDDIKLSSAVGDMADAFEVKGTLSGWLNATQFYGDKDMEFHAMVLLICMGAPLMAFTGLDGVTVSMYSPESGTGKSTTGHVASSIWGIPKLTELGRNDTLNASYRKIATLHNIAPYFDEMTNTEPSDASDLVYNIPNGRERRRMTQHAEVKETGSWSTPAAISTNRSFKGKLLDNKLTSEGELQRLIEYTFKRNSIFDGTRNTSGKGAFIERTIEENHGIAGPLILNAICRIPDKRALIETAYEAMQREFKFVFEAKERFAKAAHVLAYLMGRIGTRIGVVNFDYRPAMRASLQHIASERNEATANAVDAIDVLGMFTNDHAHSTIYEKNDLSVTGRGPVVAEANVRGEIRARYEVTHNGKGKLENGMYYVDRARFNRWCQEKGIDSGHIINEFKRKGVAVDITRIALGRRSCYITNACWCYQINLLHPLFAGRIGGLDSTNNAMLIAVTGGAA